MKTYILSLIAAVVTLSSCSENVVEEQYTFEEPKYTLVFQSASDFNWSINELSGTLDSVDVTNFSTIDVEVTLAKDASLTCIVYKGEYPIFYRVSSCQKSSAYQFSVDIQ
ncbi:hypothetical protein [Phaeocystidibacter luteus]|uniref:Uncharacterized protein n=1 Tax=Phaeocystidibacter luteus TaxID=911197 RepID=A0A6N6RGJ0_9FLAO|nr:hypothetical protein [Phaeocystidibacter luteus]KAB2810299.1 hypothetical protein F8C67_06855 [Phaeocystidibacter luteus]